MECLPEGSSEFGQLDLLLIPGPTQAASPFQSLTPSEATNLQFQGAASWTEWETRGGSPT